MNYSTKIHESSESYEGCSWSLIQIVWNVGHNRRHWLCHLIWRGRNPELRNRLELKLKLCRTYPIILLFILIIIDEDLCLDSLDHKFCIFSLYFHKKKKNFANLPLLFFPSHVQSGHSWPAGRCCVEVWPNQTLLCGQVTAPGLRLKTVEWHVRLPVWERISFICLTLQVRTHDLPGRTLLINLFFPPLCN